MKATAMVVAKGAQRCTHLTHAAGFLAVALEGTASNATVDTWYVGIFHIGPEWETKSEMFRVVYQRSAELDPAALPVSLSISADGVLAVGLGRGGVRLYALGIPIGPKALTVHELDNVQLSGGTTLFAKWINRANSLRALVTRTAYSSHERLMVHGHLAGSGGRVAHELLKTPAGAITHVATSVPGNIAIHENVGQILHVLMIQEEDQEFIHKTIQLMQLEKDRATTVNDQQGVNWNGQTFTTSLAIGDELVAVGLSPAQVGGPPGVVEAFCLETGAMVARRLTPGCIPTALCTSGSRVLLATSLTAASFGSHLCHETPDTENLSGIYAFTTNNPHNFTVSKGGSQHSYWPQGTLHMDERSWCYARTQQTDSGVVTVIQHASVPPR